MANRKVSSSVDGLIAYALHKIPVSKSSEKFIEDTVCHHVLGLNAACN